MIILTGNSLNERHRELNSKVNEAATNGVFFYNVKSQNEETDVDRLFKIDLANKCRNIFYIIETLKCGDSLYITRALKCTWLYQDELSHIVNPDYLEQNVFPEMSFKMKRKFLKLISQHVSNSDRAALFCSYCIKIKLHNIALKFLWYAPESYKADVIRARRIVLSDQDMINVIGNSFTLAYVVLNEHNRIYSLIYPLSYLYSVSEDKFLDLVEKYIFGNNLFWRLNQKFGLRLSKNIIKNHKDRLFRRTELYLNLLNKKMLVKYSTQEDVKLYVKYLCTSVWLFYKQYQFIFDVFPEQERLSYLREIFKSYHPSEEFEMNMEFYNTGLYKLMTKEERESWALEHVKAGLEHFGHGKDYKWYQFVSFDKAFEPLKKYLLIAANTDIRNEIVNVLTRSAQSNRDLEKLFTFYYKRFVNEMSVNKASFLDDVLKMHEFSKYDENCWQAFNKILHSMDVYDNKNAYNYNAQYKVVAIIYAIIHNIEVHEALKEKIDNGLNLLTLSEHTNKLPAEKAEMVYNYLFTFYLQKINNFNIDNYDDNVKFDVRKHINHLLDLMVRFEKPKEDIPEIVMNFIKLDPEEYQSNYYIKKQEEIILTQLDLIKDLKKDASQVVSKITLVKEELERQNKINLALLYRKLKIYFANDIAPKYVEMYNNILTSDELFEKTYSAAVYGLLNLTNYAERMALLSKYIPTDSKIDHIEIERKTLYIRTAICKFLCVSRPAIPLSETQKYIVGDYLKFCMPMFQSYAANLQPEALRGFVKYLLKSAASIQKHGIRMAFECFSVENLKIIMTDGWRKTKNVSLRLVMYRDIHKKILNEHDEHLQKQLFETLKAFTLDVREDDDDELFKEMNKTTLPSHVLCEHILSTWKVLNTLPYKKIMINRMTVTLNNMIEHYGLMQQEAMESIVSEHITKMLTEKEILHDCESYLKEFYITKWILTIKYIMHLPSQELLEPRLKIAETLFKESIKVWNTEREYQYVVKSFLISFIKILGTHICFSVTDVGLRGVEIMNQMLKYLLDTWPLLEIYNTVWYIRLLVLTANVIIDVRRSVAEDKARQDDGDGDDDDDHDAEDDDDDDNDDDDDDNDDDDNDDDDDDYDSKPVFTFWQYIDNFAKEFASLFNEFIEENNCYTFAFGEISKLLDQCVYILKADKPVGGTDSNECIYTIICSRLVDIEKYETYKFAVEILPQNREYTQLYRDVTDKILSFGNNNIKYYHHMKFHSSRNYGCID